MLGGLYLAFEGAEKVYEYFFAHPHVREEEAGAVSEEEILEHEAKKIKSAILTDFILSIEIVIIALGTVVGKELPIQIAVVSSVAVLATIGVYGFVALLVRMDDMGFKLIAVAANKNRPLEAIGKALVLALPKVIKLLTVVGTLAMLLVAGGIYLHNVHPLHEALRFMPSLLAELITGVVIGAIVLMAEKLFAKAKAGVLKRG